MLQVAEGGLDQIHGMLTRLKELATQAASDNTVNADALDDEAQELVAEIQRTAESTEYSGVYLLDGSYASGTATVDIQVGASNTAHHRLSFNIEAATAGALGTTASANGLNDITLTSVASAQNTMDIVDEAIADVSTVRAKIGANQNRLSYTANNLSTTIENITASESVIRDADIAAEMTNFTKNQILQQAGTAMLAQANALPQSALALLGG